LKPLTTAETLQVWEEAAGLSPFEKPLRLLAIACSVNDLNQLSHLSIGERDARLLQLREWMFGNTLRNKVSCPKCTEIIEWETDTKDLHLQSFTPSFSVREFSLNEEGYSIQFRLPDSLDIARINRRDSEEAIYRKLISNCIVTIDKDGQQYSPADLPGSVLEALDRKMGEEDPQADLRVNLTCPACRHTWETYFDIAGYLWSEINNWAQRLLQEVYLLAKAFSWSERDILAMSAQRRHLYLKMLNA